MEDNQLLLEYNERQECFHINTRDTYHGGRWDHELYSNGWHPICLIDKEVFLSSSYDRLISRLSCKGYSLDYVMDKIVDFLKNYGKKDKLN